MSEMMRIFSGEVLSSQEKLELGGGERRDSRCRGPRSTLGIRIGPPSSVSREGHLPHIQFLFPLGGSDATVL